LQSKVRFASGQVVSGFESLHAARHEAAYGGLPAPLRRALSLRETELRVASGDLAAARRLLSSWPGEEPQPDWATTVEASLLLAEGRSAAAAATLAPLCAARRTSASLSRTVQAGVLTALAGRLLADRDRMVRGLELATEAAGEEGFRRTFVAAGRDLREVARAVRPELAVCHPIVAELAEAHDPAIAMATTNDASMLYDRRPRTGPLAEHLTERELTVLRYLQGTLSNLEIASMLYVSVNTVKTHVKNIYRKLDAGQRREAVRRARDLRLL